VVIPSRFTIYSVFASNCHSRGIWRASVGCSLTKNLSNGSNLRISNSWESLPLKHIFLKFKFENVINMENEPDSALLQTSYLSNQFRKRTLKSRDTIPLGVDWQFFADSINHSGTSPTNLAIFIPLWRYSYMAIFGVFLFLFLDFFAV
jgi:hypothetical protein